MSPAPAILVIAKAPVPGRVKTRLTPPCTPEQAAALARAALEDTLEAAAGCSAGRRVVVLDGQPGDWLPGGFDVIAQRGGGLAERLAGAFEDAGAPALLVGMDTPQVTPALLDDGLAALADGHDAVFGDALDGGYWTIGLKRADGAVFAGVPMSAENTGAVQRARLFELDLDPRVLPPLRDVDHFEDAIAVAALAPGSRFAAAVTRVRVGLP